MTYEGVPGLVETREALGETTLVVDPARLVEACTHLRDEQGFNLLLDITATDYLGWGERAGRRLHRHAGRTRPQLSRRRRATRARPSRSRSASRSATTCCGSPTTPRACASRSGSTTARRVETVIPVWPTADWHEREAWDMMGIAFDGHPNPTRILMDDDWEGHPLRKDYPIGGEPVRFSGEE